MGTSRASWVPPGTWLAPGYAEWAAPAALRGPVTCLWTRVVPEDSAPSPALVLPDACSDLIWEQDIGAYVAGPDTGPVHTQTRPGAVFVGVRFRPAAGGQVLGLPLSDLRDQRVPLADLLKDAACGLPATLPAAEAAAHVLGLAGTLIADSNPDPAISAAAALLRDPAAHTEDVAARVGLSERQLRRRSHAAIGYGPKTLQRVLRFQRFVRMIDAAEPVDLAGAAARLGYADQPHLTRDCAALSGLTPAELVKVRRRLTRLRRHHVGAERGERLRPVGQPKVRAFPFRHQEPSRRHVEHVRHRRPQHGGQFSELGRRLHDPGVVVRPLSPRDADRDHEGNVFTARRSSQPLWGIGGGTQACGGSAIMAVPISRKPRRA